MTALLLWTLRDLLIVIFAATLLAVILESGARATAQRLAIGYLQGLILVVTAVVAALAGMVWQFGHELSSQIGDLSDRVPEAWEVIRSQIVRITGTSDLIPLFQSLLPDGARIVDSLGAMVRGISGALAGLVLALVGGVYLAAQPSLYRNGVLHLVPHRWRGLVQKGMDSGGHALKLWLKGQLVAMLLVGLLTGCGAWLIGLPSPLALGMIAGLLEFVPYFGPFAAAVPAILIALTAGPDMVLLTIGLYLVVQQLEGNVITPVVQQRVVHLPAALTMFSQVAFALLFGISGVMLAAPMTVLIYVLVNRLYVQDYLGRQAAIPDNRDPADKGGDQAA